MSGVMGGREGTRRVVQIVTCFMLVWGQPDDVVVLSTWCDEDER